MSEILQEQETQINFDEDGDSALVFTASPRVMKLLKRRGLLPYKADKDIKGSERGWFFEVPKSAVLLKPTNRMVRIGGSKINSKPVETHMSAKSS